MMKTWVLIAVNPYGLGEVLRAEVDAINIQSAINGGTFNQEWILSARLKNLVG